METPQQPTNANSGEANKLASSKFGKILLLVLTILYCLTAIGGFFVLSLGKDRIDNYTHAKLMKGSIQSTIAGVAWLSASVCVFRKKRGADLISGLAAVVTGLFAGRAFIGSLNSGFQAVDLIEPVVILPSIGYILFLITRSKSPSKL